MDGGRAVDSFVAVRYIILIKCLTKHKTNKSIGRNYRTIHRFVFLIRSDEPAQVFFRPKLIASDVRM